MEYYVNKEELEYFILNNVNSLDLNIIVTKWNNLSSPGRNKEIIEVDGRNGALIIDKGNYTNFELEIEIAIDGAKEDTDIKAIASQVKKWLFKNSGYSKLILSDDLENYYEATFINKLDIEEVLNELGEAKLTFSCKPFKMSNTNDLIEITQQSTIVSNNGYACEPIIKILGTGDCIVSINNQKLILKALEGEIIIDCDLMNAYRIDSKTGAMINQNQKMFSDFPLLEEGDNTITWTGNVTKIEITPNFKGGF